MVKKSQGNNCSKLRSFRIHPWLCWMLAGVILVAWIVWLLHWGMQVSQDWATLQQYPTDAAKKKFDASLEIAKAIVSGVGTIATIGGGIVLYLNFRVASKNVEIANKNAEIANKNAELTESRLITERFSKAVEQLASDKLEVRLGGIYALERIAYDSDRDYWTIMEVLTSFIQEKTSIKKITEKKIRIRIDKLQKNNGVGTDEQIRGSAIKELTAELVTRDVQAALTVIGRTHRKDPDGKRLDLSGANLTGAKLTRNFSRANLSEAILNDANLIRINLSSADLTGANLNRTNLSEAILNGAIFNNASLIDANLNVAELHCANLSNADLRGAILHHAKLQGAKLHGANLNGADLIGATLSDVELMLANLNSAGLNDVNFSNANLSDADFSNANLHEANLHEANLHRTNLTGTNLTKEQLEVAKLCQTKLPAHITKLSPNRDCKALGLPDK
jgi:uncharacterized protein YjbI with pentapeptide repeats